MISQYGRRATRRKSWFRSSLFSQLVTFTLGAIVGACLYYAYSEIYSEKVQEQQPTAQVDTSPEPVIPAQAVVPEVVPPVQPEYAIEPIPADMDSMWPLRHVIVGVEGTHLSRKTIEMLNAWKPAGVWLRENNTENPRQIEEMISLINLYASLDGSREKNPLICMAQEGGQTGNLLQIDGALTCQELAALDSLDAIKKAGRQVAETALSAGVGVLLAPRLDLFFPGRSREEDRPHYFGDNKESVIQAGLAYAGGLMEAGALSVVSSYPGMGSVVHQPRRLPVVEETDIEKLAEIMLPFAEAAAYDISGILVGNVSVPALDKERPDRPASLSPRLVREVLRRQFGYTGVVLASDIIEAGVWSGNEPETDLVDALKAGCDAVLISSANTEQLGRIAQEVMRAADRGILNKSELDASARRLDSWRQQIARQRSAVPAEVEGEPHDVTETIPESAPAVPEADVVPETVKTAPAEKEAAESAEETPAPSSETAPPRSTIIDQEAVPELVEEKQPQAKSPEEVEATPAAVQEAVPVIEETAPPQEEKPAAPQEKAVVQETKKDTPSPQPQGTKMLSYTIQPGDTLSKIATTHQVSSSDLMKWNGLTNGDIKFGKKLTIYVPEAGNAPEQSQPSGAEVSVEKTVEDVVTEIISPDHAAAAETESEGIAEAAPVQETAGNSPETAAALEAVTTEQVETEPVTAEDTSSVPEAEEIPPPLTPSRETEKNSADEVLPEEATDVISDLDSQTDFQPASDLLEPSDEKQDERPESMIPPVSPPVEYTQAPDDAPVQAENSADENKEASSQTEDTATPEFGSYVIQVGDTLHSIAKRYNTTVQNLMAINGIQDANLIVLGKEIKVPLP